MMLERGRRIHHHQRRQGLLLIQLIDHHRDCETFPAFHQIESGSDRLIVAVAHPQAQDTMEKAQKRGEYKVEKSINNLNINCL